MSKHLYRREQALEDYYAGSSWDIGEYIPPMDFNNRYGWRSVSKAYRTVPDGPFSTSVNVGLHSQRYNEMLDNVGMVPELVIALMAGFYLFLRK
jgi:hypothetical protein